jgi:hypothetical protein
MNRTLAFGLAALVLFGSGCASVPSESVEDQVSGVIEAWKAAWLSSDIEATENVYSENFVGDFQPDILAGEDFAEFVAESRIVTEEATVTLDGNTATVAPIFVEHEEIGIYIEHTLTKESGGWKITGTKGEEMDE